MKVDVSFLPRQAQASETVLLIDVLRFSTTACMALNDGVAKLIPCRSLEESLQKQHPEDLLAGEKGGKKIEGFDLGNSPSAFQDRLYAGRVIRFLTSNGSPACFLASSGKNAYLGSFVNHRVALRRLSASGANILILCSGEKGSPSEEDIACAGCFVDGFGNKAKLGDSAKQALNVWEEKGKDPAKVIFESSWGKKLLSFGLKADLDIACRLDAVEVVPKIAKAPLRIILDGRD